MAPWLILKFRPQHPRPHDISQVALESLRVFSECSRVTIRYHNCITRNTSRSTRHMACGLEPSADINTVPPPLSLDIILSPQSLSLVFPSTPTSSSTSETRWVRLTISSLHSSLRRTELTPEWSNWIVAFKTCIGFLDPSIVAEQSLMPAEVRTR
jgi:hypothetical protein